MLKKSTWERHVNPWSVWTRVPLLPLFALVVFLRGPLGGWTWLLLAALFGWTLINPKAFPPPALTDSWASRGVLGERVWLNRKAVPIPPHHARWALGLSLATGLFLIPLIWGLYALDPWATALGAIGASMAKLWFIDRMVWLYQDMQDATPEYAGWLR